MPVTQDDINKCIDKIKDTYKALALGNKGDVTVDRFDVNFPKVDLKVTVLAKQTVHIPLTHREDTVFSLTSNVEGTIDLTNVEESAKKLNLKIHTPLGNPSVSVEDAEEVVKFLVTVLG